MQKKLNLPTRGGTLRGLGDGGVAIAPERTSNDVWTAERVNPRGVVGQSRVRLTGPFELTFDFVERVIPSGQGGVFALGQVDAAGTFRVQRVGRSESDLRGGLKALIGCENQFKFALTGSVREAFEYECELFHRLRPPSSIIHPTRSPGTDWKCHLCTHLHL